MKRIEWALAIAIAIAAPALGHAEDARWQVGSAPSVSTGRYGTATRTAVLYTPITVRRLFDAGDITVVLPITCVRGSEGVTVINGLPVRNDRLDRVSDDGRSVRRAAASGLATECGPGDVVVRGRYYLVDERGWMPTVAVRGHVKTPTASAERGLGTGEFDQGIGLEISRTVAGGLTAMIDGGYTRIGEPPGVDLRNAWWYDAGLARDLGGAVNLAVFFEDYRAIVPGLPSARDLLAALTIRGASGWQVQVSGQWGLSDSAPDHGLGLGVSRRF